MNVKKVPVVNPGYQVELTHDEAVILANLLNTIIWHSLPVDARDFTSDLYEKLPSGDAGYYDNVETQ